MNVSREHRILATAAVLAIGAPIGAAAWVGARRDALGEHLGSAAGVPSRIGGVDADLTGTVRLSDVALGNLMSAEAVEASVALERLLGGQLGADEIRVAAPNVALEIDRNGDSDLARLVRRMARGGGGSGGTRVRRVVVSSGTLTARIAGIGELTADGVELVPDANGVRVITGRVTLHGSAGRVSAELELARAGAEVALPGAKLGRVLAVGGTGRIVVADAGALTLHDVAVGRLMPGGPLEARGLVEDGGAERRLSLQVSNAEVVVGGEKIPLAAFQPIVPHAVDVSHARATGELALARDHVRIAGTIDRLRLDHSTLAPQPIEISPGVAGTFSIGPDALALADGHLDLGGAHFTASGWWRRGQPASGQLDLRVAEAPCAELLASLPAEIRGPLDGIAMTGTFAGHGRLAIDLAAPPGDGVELDLDLHNACTVTAEPPAADVTQLAGVAEHTFPDGSRARIGKGEPGWLELRHLPGYVSGAFISAEDARFRDHHGFDVHQIARSLEIDLRDRRLARGGSTISQQVVKNVFLTQRRSLDRKLQEAILTWRLESRLDKSQILERYLNIIELGPHVFGLTAAARYWFDTEPRDLTIRQAAFLAALTSEPTSMSHRVRHASGLDPDSAARVETILRAMHRDGVIDKDELAHARDAGLHFVKSVLHAEP